MIFLTEYLKAMCWVHCLQVPLFVFEKSVLNCQISAPGVLAFQGCDKITRKDSSRLRKWSLEEKTDRAVAR